MAAVGMEVRTATEKTSHSSLRRRRHATVVGRQVKWHQIVLTERRHQGMSGAHTRWQVPTKMANLKMRKL